MTAIAFDIPAEITQIVAGIERFLRADVYNCARAVGLPRWALETAIRYAGERIAFGVPIGEHQGVAFPLAESAMQVHAAHLMGLNAARLLDRGERAIKELSMAKAYYRQLAKGDLDL